MPSTVIDKSGESAGESQAGRLTVLLCLPTIVYYSMFENLVGALLSAGHKAVVSLDHDRREVPPDQADLLAEPVAERSGPWRIAASAIRRTLDYLRYLEPESGAPDEAREQARQHVPPAVRALLVVPPFRWGPGRRALASLLRGVEAAIPRPGRVRSFVSSRAPDVVVISPLIEFGSSQADYVRAATAARVPSALVVASEDELIGGGVIREVPTLTVTRSEAGVNDLVRFHHLPRERIVTVGAERAGGREQPATSGAVDAIERAARTNVDSQREGRLLRPLLWLMTPLLAVLLVLLRPRATLRAVIRAPRRLVSRLRKRARARRRRRSETSKASGAAAKARRLAAAEELRARKKARAEAKAQKTGRAAGASTSNGGARASADAKEPPAGKPHQ